MCEAQSGELAKPVAANIDWGVGSLDTVRWIDLSALIQPGMSTVNASAEQCWEHAEFLLLRCNMAELS